MAGVRLIIVEEEELPGPHYQLAASHPVPFFPAQRCLDRQASHVRITATGLRLRVEDHVAFF